MRLINSGSLEFKEFFESELPAYAILSHCWSDNEISYQDWLRRRSEDTSRPKWKKILRCCSIAKEANLDWVWIDTCCIDKSSSAELSEAINSMFGWYQNATVCYVFLSDLDVAGKDPNRVTYEFSRCRWFTRGWTLQELIAPQDIRFFDTRLQCIGTKEDLSGQLASIAKVNVGYLTGSLQIRDAGIAERMSWASRRSTTRTEDIAYCLLGIFGVNMPLLYGEGIKAFDRLQQAIISQSDDESIFAWLSNEEGDLRGMLASSPAEFEHTASVRPIQYARKRPPATFSSRGLEIHHAYTHPLVNMWDKFCEMIPGGTAFATSDAIPLRLDCEITDQGTPFWIGVSLRRNQITGSWYREDASKLLHARQHAHFGRIYPTFAGFKRIYVETPRHHLLAAPSQSMPAADSRADVLPEYSRSISVSLLWLICVLLSVTTWLWIMSAVYYHLGLSSPNTLLSWAFLTGTWHLMGQTTDTLLVVFIHGLCGWDFNLDSYSSRNIFTAILGSVPLTFLQVHFDMFRWETTAMGQ